MQYARVFLSHAGADKPLVEAVAHALARRGIIAWLDIYDLYADLDLTRALAKAIREHTLIIVFLSEAALRSAWVDDELAIALAQEDSARSSQYPPAVMPVFLGNPLDLVQQHSRLLSRWLHPDGKRADRRGIKDLNQGTKKARAQHIANELARTLYQRMHIDKADDVAVILDQRGDGMRTGLPTSVPHNFEVLDIPALVFRPAPSPRTHDEVLRGQEWQELSSDLVQALSHALGQRRPTPRKIRILGASQLALPFLLGQRLNRTYGAALYCYNRDGGPLMLDMAQFPVPLTGGNPDCARMDDRLSPLTQVTAGMRTESLVLILLKDSPYLQQARDYLLTRDNPPPVAWIPHPPGIQSADEVLTLARDIKAFFEQVGARTVELLTSLPFHALPLLGALLSPHVLSRVTFLEHDRRAVAASDGYVPLPLP